jgi:L-cystine uptake protein TcyP (sodium:dicarboxylate symporter family)
MNTNCPIDTVYIIIFKKLFFGIETIGKIIIIRIQKRDEVPFRFFYTQISAGPSTVIALVRMLIKFYPAVVLCKFPAYLQRIVRDLSSTRTTSYTSSN